MRESSYKTWDKGVFSVVGEIGGPANCETTYRFLRDHDGLPTSPIYSDTDITYVWNKYGFRSDEFVDDGRGSIMALGCSNTMGMGVPVEHSWPHILRDMINPSYKLYNLALSGSSGDYAVRAVHKTIDELKPSAIFVLWPGYSAKELMFRKRHIPYMPEVMHGRPNRDILSEFHDVLADASNAVFQYQKNRAMLNAIAGAAKIPVCDLNVISENAILPLAYLDQHAGTSNKFDMQTPVLIGSEFDFPMARDNFHRGYEWHQYIANLFYDQYISVK